MKNNWLIAGIIAIVIVLGIGFFIFKPQSSQNTQSNLTGLEKYDSQTSIPNAEISQVVTRVPESDNTKEIKTRAMPEMQIDQNKNYTATLKTTDGDIVISLNAKQTPITVNNFVSLAKEKFYDNTIFHRVIKGFMIQGGDPMGNGTGGPGYKFDDEPFTGEYTKGTVAMANSGPNTNGSQFFIMHQDYALPKNYVIFGKVTQGLDVVDKIATAQVRDSVSGEMSDPVNPVKITSVEISEN